MPSYRPTSYDVWNIIFTLVFLALAGIASYLWSSEVASLSALDIVIISLAIFRLIRLASYDKIMSFKRNFFSQFETGLGKSLYEMLICPWCTGIWIALGIVPFYTLIPETFLLILIIALAGLGTLIQLFAGMLTRIGR